VPSLVHIEVRNLLNRFSHEFQFPADWEFIILHGPNGVGKTKLLELIKRTLSADAAALRKIPFTNATFGFDDGTVIEVDKGQRPSMLRPEDGEDIFENPESEDSEDRERLRIIMRTPGKEVVSWTPEPLSTTIPRSRLAAILEERAPVTRLEPDLWHDFRTGETLNLEEVLSRYGDSLPVRLTGNRRQNPVLREFLASQPVHLIETQRLLQSHSKDIQRHPRSARERTFSRVTEYSQDLSARLADVLARNSRVSQDLDRTFPRRVLFSQFAPAEATEERIRERYANQIELRSALEEIAVQDDTTEEVRLPDRALTEWERRLLWTYLDDAERKLSTFQNLLERISLLKNIVDARFLFKELKIDRERGFYFATDQSEELAPSQLSSGEQHELVLVYDLLFNVKPGSLVLIDEPEISLHVTWQQKFLGDMARIAKVASLRFVIATHSPQIIHDWWSRTIALAPDVEAER
jgi:ABC-type lipoprotein export system ATPase subunit